MEKTCWSDVATPKSKRRSKNQKDGKTDSSGYNSNNNNDDDGQDVTSPSPLIEDIEIVQTPHAKVLIKITYHPDNPLPDYEISEVSSHRHRSKINQEQVEQATKLVEEHVSSLRLMNDNSNNNNINSNSSMLKINTGQDEDEQETCHQQIMKARQNLKMKQEQRWRMSEPEITTQKSPPPPSKEDPPELGK